MKKILGIIGAGHLGQQIAHYAKANGNCRKIVFFDDFTNAKEICDIEVIGKTNFVLEAYRENKINEIIIAIGYNHMDIRKQLFNQFVEKIPFAQIIHSTAWVDSTVKLGQGVVIYPGCIIDANVTIDANVLLNVGCVIAHDTQIGAHSFLSPRVSLAGFVNIGSQCVLGINSCVIDNIEIASNTQLGGGAVVIDTITVQGIYVGNPARKIK